MKLVQKLGLAIVMLVSMNVVASNQFSAERIAERIAPEATPCVEGQECKSAEPAAAPAASTTAAVSSAPSAKDTYQGKCFACHGTGAAGAPIVGDKAAWQARIGQGADSLYAHAIDGFNMMPPKGGCADCSDADIKAVVDFMVDGSK